MKQRKIKSNLETRLTFNLDKDFTMKKALLILAISSISTLASANCTKTGSITSCYDSQSGNSYTTYDFGTSSITNGSNANTGTTWSQNTTRLGDSSFSNGTSSTGTTWNQSTTRFGDMSITNGSSSSGKSWNSTTFGNGSTIHNSSDGIDSKSTTCDAFGNCYYAASD